MKLFRKIAGAEINTFMAGAGDISIMLQILEKEIT